MATAPVTSPSPSLLSAQFRANPEFELVLFDRLSDQQKKTLENLRRDPDFYGVLQPRDSGRADCGIKSISRDAALLYLTLSSPSPLPSYFGPSLGSAAIRTVRQLVLDRVLEIEHGGRFLTGSNARQALGLTSDNGAAPSRPALLSREALEFSSVFTAGDVVRLAARLYSYNRAPLSPEWRRPLHSREATSQYLGTDILRLNNCGAYHSTQAESSAWLAWDFRNRVQPLESSTRLQEMIGGIPPQGVPFTAELAGEGLLSWGMDPPGTDSLPWSERESWRQWITNRLAMALRQAQAEGCGTPCDFAIDRLRLEGIDSDTWMPGRTFGQQQTT